MSTQMPPSPARRDGLAVTLVVEQLRRAVPGGIGSYARGLLKGLAELAPGARPRLTLLASRPVSRPDPLLELGYPVTASRLPAAAATRLWHAGLLSLKGPGDVVHAVSTGVPRVHGPRLVATVHDLAWRVLPDAYPARGRKWHEAALHHVSSRAAHVVVPSDATANALLRAGVGIGPDRVTVIHEGSDLLPEPDDGATEALLASLGVDGPYLLSVSTLEPRKNLRRLIESYGLARPKLPGPWPLVVVGPKGWGSELSGTEPGVVLAGRVRDEVLAGLYRRARCVAYVPLLEGFGLPVAEAMAAGVPVVASRVPAGGDATLEVDPLDRSSIADGILVAALDEAARSELAGRGAIRAAELSWADTARRHVELWADVAGHSRGSPR